MTDHLPEKRPPSSEILFYQTEDGRSQIEVRLDQNTVWLSQNLMAELFQTTKQNISLHIQNIYAEGELVREGTVKEYLTVQREGARRISRSLEYYNLDVIISVGYRVKSHRGTQFRKWATERLREYLVKGFTMDDERLKEGRAMGADYFGELLERIRDIRASEKRFYQKIRDIYKLAIDYDAEAEETKEFFQIVQNKLHWAITGKTAAELIAERADSSKANIGLTSWKGSKVRRTDVAVAKNYLSIEEIGELNRIVVMYLDYAEDQARRRKPLYMRDWRDKIDAFLKFNERAILEDAGNVSMEVAKALALEEYERFNRRRLVEEAAKEEEEFEKIARQLEQKGRRKKK
ncbi:MAG: hydroxyacid dehydrogenase [Deltaproteobacteria bacterium RBG_16_48_10]|nr:MAG: hydroxyacid dehydrogenase [Deltaproteobacteria bacterium RBG_16_48_10]